MSGCRWQEKSFSVVVKQAIMNICSECSLPSDVLHKYNGDLLCQKCFSLKPSKGDFSSFNTHKDLAYNFTTEMFNGKPVQIHSKRQFKHLLKVNRMADASPKECFDEARFRKKLNEEDYARDRKKTAETIYRKMKDRGQLNGRK